MAIPMVDESPSTQRLLEYHARRTEVLRAVNRRPYGTRADISRTLVVSPATISGVLTGRIVSPQKLRDIEEWLRRS